MALAAFKRVVTKVFELSQVQANISAIFDQIRLNPFVTGQRYQAQAIATAGTKLYHGLGYVPEGWLVTNLNGNATIYLTAPTTAVPNPTTSYIILQSSAAVTADLWVF